ncbi:MAG: class I SAM-dependent methyltransferase [Victivallales bacterium]|nr:class I SAM-dependent methyltransferase [Victivallales bacterium]
MSGANEYKLLDSGAGRKLERFGTVVADRPCAQAVWRPALPKAQWDAADAFFTRENHGGWTFRRRVPREWECELEGIRFLLTPTDFGHLGVFPEHALGWRWMKERVASAKRPLSILNLFAYTGGATLALAKLGCQVCHLDASKKAVDWAHRNATANHLDGAPIRWIVDDVFKFLQREQRRGRKYDGIVLDPPSFGRGTNQELFKIDDSLPSLLDSCFSLLSERPSFVFLTCHTPGYTPMVLQHLMEQTAPHGNITTGEMRIEHTVALPSGSYAAWSAEP